MNRGATRSYRCGTKNNWTRRGWNRVLDLTAGREKRHPILYLSGPEDFDRRVAISKGVPPTNLVAVDDFQRNVNRVRRHKGVAICADVIDVLYAWPRRLPVSALVLDFCNGFEPERLRGLMNVMWREPFADAWVWLNLQRGRDSNSNALRSSIADLFGTSTKNRAYQFFFLLTASTIAATEASGRLDPSLTVNDCLAHMARKYRPIFDSYKSRGDGNSVVVFDSVILRAQPGDISIENFELTDRFEREIVPNLSVRRRVSANLAHRTMREDR